MEFEVYGFGIDQIKDEFYMIQDMDNTKGLEAKVDRDTYPWKIVAFDDDGYFCGIFLSKHNDWGRVLAAMGSMWGAVIGEVWDRKERKYFGGIE